MTRSVHRKQRAIKPASTPQTQADMAKYYEMLKGAKNDKEDKTNTNSMGPSTR